MTTPIPPHQQAYLDQMRTRLAELTEWVRVHKARGCEFPTACPGDRALEWIENHPHDANAVLMLALVDRAAAPEPERRA